MPKRHDAVDIYRYGFQGQEKDDEIKGEGNSINYKYRMHDPRVGRFFAVDPLTKKYPWYSPYQFAGNSVIEYNELEGLEMGQNYADKNKANYAAKLKNENPEKYVEFVKEQVVSNAREAGFTNTIEDAVVGTIDTYKDPVATATNTWLAVTHPIKTLTAIKDALFDWGNRAVSEDREVRANAHGQFVGTSFMILIGSKAPLPKTPTKAVASIIEKIEIPSGIPLDKRHGLVTMGIGGAHWLKKYMPNDPKIMNGCEKVATKIRKEIGGMYLQITNKYGPNLYLGPINNVVDTHPWKHHVAVIKEGRVYDHLTGADGMLLDDYKKMFDYADDLDFKPVEKLDVK